MNVSNEGARLIPRCARPRNFRCLSVCLQPREFSKFFCVRALLFVGDIHNFSPGQVRAACCCSEQLLWSGVCLLWGHPQFSPGQVRAACCCSGQFSPDLLYHSCICSLSRVFQHVIVGSCTWSSAVSALQRVFVLLLVESNHRVTSYLGCRI